MNTLAGSTGVQPADPASFPLKTEKTFEFIGLVRYDAVQIGPVPGTCR